MVCAVTCSHVYSLIPGPPPLFQMLDFGAELSVVRPEHRDWGAEVSCGETETRSEEAHSRNDRAGATQPNHWGVREVGRGEGEGWGKGRGVRGGISEVWRVRSKLSKCAYVMCAWGLRPITELLVLGGACYSFYLSSFLLPPLLSVLTSRTCTRLSPCRLYTTRVKST